MSESPLMLSIMILAYSDSSGHILPEFDSQDEQRRYLFERYMTRMLERYATNLYTKKQVMSYLNWFARRMLIDRKTVFYIEEMQPAWLQRKWQFRIYRLIDEFAEQLRGMLRMSAGAGFILGVLVFVSSPFVLHGLQGLAVGLMVGLVAGIFFWLSDALSIVQIADTQFNQLEGGHRTQQHTAASKYLVRGQGAPQFQGYSQNIAAFTVQIADLRDEAEKEPTTIPNELIWRAVRRATWIFLGSYGLLGLGYGITFGILWGILCGLLGAFIITAASRPGDIVMRHVLIRLMLYQDGIIPLNVAHFLNYCTRLILLRKIGGGYIFIHRYLLEYFAGLDET
jgi:hypothetical protein